MDSYSWFSDVDKLEAVQLLVFISHGGYEPQYGKSSGYGAKINEKTCPNPVFWNYQEFRSSSVIANISNNFLINTKGINILSINTKSDSEEKKPLQFVYFDNERHERHNKIHFTVQYLWSKFKSVIKWKSIKKCFTPICMHFQIG